MRTNKKLSYDTLGQTPGLSRDTALNYITKPEHRRDARTLELLLTALGAPAQERAHVLQLHQQTQPQPVDAAEVGWAARARAAGCVVWPMAKFTAVAATVHTAIGRRQPAVPEHGPKWGRGTADVRAPRPRPGTTARHRAGRRRAAAGADRGAGDLVDREDPLTLEGRARGVPGVDGAPPAGRVGAGVIPLGAVSWYG